MKVFKDLALKRVEWIIDSLAFKGMYDDEDLMNREWIHLPKSTFSGGHHEDTLTSCLGHSLHLLKAGSAENYHIHQFDSS